MSKADLGDFLIKGNLNLLPATFLDEKDSQILSKVTGLMRYWHDDELYPSLLFSLLRLPREFKKIRSAAHVRRVICAEFFYKKEIIKSIDQHPHKRHLLVKILKTRLEFPFGYKDVLGIIVTFNLIKQREAFEEGHILETLRNIIPGISLVKGSFIDYQDKKNQVHNVYLEIEQDDKQPFSLKEIKQLQQQLPVEFKGCIQQLVPITFMRRNEEEVYRNIVSLRDQLKSIRDIPQATITFEEQTQFDLFFTVVLLRFVKATTPTIQEILINEHPDLLFIPDRIDQLGKFHKQYWKEATVFRIQLPKNQFFRKDRSVNLYKARQRVLSMLEQALGPIRDYNGGLMLKQNERLEDFLALMPKVYDEFFLENFFYSITPIAMQSILPATLVKEWFLAFSELLEKELTRESPYLLLCRQIEEVQMIVVRAEVASFKELLLKDINALAIPSLELAFSEVNMYGAFCFGFLYRPSLISPDYPFCETVKSTMVKWSARVSEEQTLRILIHGSDPSLDPRLPKGDQSFIIIKMLFDGLTRMGADGKPILAMAESYMVSPDYKTFTFYLRESQWSNGAPVTAFDFEYTWKKALDSNPNSSFLHTFDMIKNAQKARRNEVSIDEVGIKAVDDKTLIVHLEYPVPYFLEVVSHWTYSLINRSIDQKHPDWAHQAGETFVCNGPFRLVEWKHSRAITVEKNPFYWDAEVVKLNKILITMNDRTPTDLTMISKGEIDIIGRPMISFHPHWLNQSIEDIERVSFPLNGVFTLFFNTSVFPFNHLKVRQAFAYCIPRKNISKLVPHEMSRDSYSLLPEAFCLNDAPLFPEEDFERAKALFDEGLKELGCKKDNLPRIILSFFNGHYRLPLFKMLCKTWKEVMGIEIQLKYYEWNTLLERMLNGEYQMGGVELNAFWSDPLHMLEFFEDKNTFLNFSFWEDPHYQTLLKEAKEAKTIEQRDLYLKEAELFLAQNVPAIPLYQLKGNYLKSQSLQNITISSNFQIDYKWAYKNAG